MGRADRIEVTSPRAGPIAPNNLHPVERRANGDELRHLRAEQLLTVLLQVAVSLIDLGVDGLMSDEPAVLRDVLERRGAWSGWPPTGTIAR